MQYTHVLSPLQIGSLELKNRFVVPAMATNFADFDGTVSDRLINYWEARARGGWGLLIQEFTYVDPRGKAMFKQPALYDDKFIAPAKKLTDTVHKHGAKMFCQIHHGGRQTVSALIGAEPVAPSPIPCPVSGGHPQELTTDEVWDLVEKFGAAAWRAREAGYDGVEVHGGHGYLVAQFMSAYSNKRTDIFGGTLLGRLRFPLEILKSIRAKVGPDFPVIIRYSGDEMVEGGRKIAESAVVGRIFQEAGYQALHITCGVYESSRYIIAPMPIQQGFLLPDAAAVKRAVSIPVIAVNRIADPAMGEAAIQAGMCDLVAMGRASLADPDLPGKVAAGAIEDIRPCVGCVQGCIDRIYDPAYGSISCFVNPATGREAELAIKPAAVKKNVVIVGGGPGGLEAAWISASRGHKVTLFEKDTHLGGQLRLGSIPPAKQDLPRAIAYWEHMVEKCGVHVKLGTEATAAAVLAEKPDAVILATGAEPLVPDLEGVDGANVVGAWDVLKGTTVGTKVLVVGGGMVGAETADYLTHYGKQVTIIEMLPAIAHDMGSLRPFLMDRLAAGGVRMDTNVTVQKFTADGVVALKDGVEQVYAGYNTIVLAMGTRPVNPLAQELEGKVEVHTIGDALKPRKAMQAVDDAAALAVSL